MTNHTHTHTNTNTITMKKQIHINHRKQVQCHSPIHAIILKYWDDFSNTPHKHKIPCISTFQTFWIPPTLTDTWWTDSVYSVKLRLLATSVFTIPPTPNFSW